MRALASARFSLVCDLVRAVMGVEGGGGSCCWGLGIGGSGLLDLVFCVILLVVVRVLGLPLWWAPLEVRREART